MSACFQSFRPLKIAGSYPSSVCPLRMRCAGTSSSDLSMDGSKDVLKEKIIALIKGIDEEEDLEDLSSFHDAA